MGMIYKWSIDIYGIDANLAGRELERIQTERGTIEPKVIIEEARPNNSLFHKVFEWDDVKAAESYRVEQAKELVRKLVVVTTQDTSDKGIETRAYVSVKSEEFGKKPSYIAISRAMSDDDLRKQILQQAINELENFKRKYSNLVEFKKIFEIIDEIAV